MSRGLLYRANREDLLAHHCAVLVLSGSGEERLRLNLTTFVEMMKNPEIAVLCWRLAKFSETRKSRKF